MESVDQQEIKIVCLFLLGPISLTRKRMVSWEPLAHSPPPRVNHYYRRCGLSPAFNIALLTLHSPSPKNKLKYSTHSVDSSTSFVFRSGAYNLVEPDLTLYSPIPRRCVYASTLFPQTEIVSFTSTKHFWIKQRLTCWLLPGSVRSIILNLELLSFTL